MNDYIVGIDIGSSRICGTVGKIDKYGKLQIIATSFVECSGIKQAVVVDIDNTALSIKSCVDQLERMVDIHINSVYISLPGGMSELINNKGVIAISSEDREIKQSDVNRVLDAAKLISVPSNKEIIGVIPKQFIVDGYGNVKDPIGMSGLRLEVDAQVITAESNVVSNLFKSVNKAEINVEGIVLQPLAISQVILGKEEMEIGTALVDVGAETIDISVFKNNNLICTDMIPIGGNSITNDISICLKISYEEAERLKIKYGNVKKVNKNQDEKIMINSGYNTQTEIMYSLLIDIIEARVEELLTFIAQKLVLTDNYNNISNIVIVGGGISFLEGIIDLGTDVIGKPIRIGIPDYIGAASPTYATSVGIVKDVADTVKLYDNNSESSLTESTWTKNEKKSNSKKGFSYRIKKFFTDFF